MPRQIDRSHLSSFFRASLKALLVCTVAIVSFWLASAPESQAASAPAALAEHPLPEITVYRDPACRCCGGWVDHLSAAGFQPQVVMLPESEEMAALKQQHGITEALASCHTAMLDRYVIEGHVPVDDMKRLLATQPNIIGISVPGMPIGTPGMESDTQQDSFNVVSFDQQGTIEIFKQYLSKDAYSDSQMDKPQLWVDGSMSG